MKMPQRIGYADINIGEQSLTWTRNYGFISVDACGACFCVAMAISCVKLRTASQLFCFTHVNVLNMWKYNCKEKMSSNYIPFVLS